MNLERNEDSNLEKNQDSKIFFPVNIKRSFVTYESASEDDVIPLIIPKFLGLFMM